MDLLKTLPQNINDNVNFLKQDYSGLGFDLSPIFNLLIGFFISFTFIITFLLLGNSIRKLFFKDLEIPTSRFLIDIAVGSIAFGSFIAIFGFFSLLNEIIIFCFLAVVFILVSFPIGESKKTLIASFYQLKDILSEFNKNKLVSIWIYLFLIIAILNLINPEIREDQYHIDFPNIYIANQTTMIPPNEQFLVSASPLLSEMTYLVSIFLWSNESARYIHFSFYILVLLTLLEYGKNKGGFFSFAPLIFATAPVVIHETSSMYVDFQWMFYFLLSILFLVETKKLDTKKIALSGFFLGAMVASKLWTVVFPPVVLIFMLFLSRRDIIKNIISKSFAFSLFFFIPSSIWLLRAWILTGNPLFPAFSNRDSYIGFNYQILIPVEYLNVYSPLFFIGILLLAYKFRDNIKLLKSNDLFKFLLILFILYLSIYYSFGRYLLGLYIFAVLLASISIYRFTQDFKISKHIINIILFFLFSYYFLNSILVLPYSFGIADKNKYLSRIFIRDASSYYDFGKRFDKFINVNDLVATYKVFGFYYAKPNLVDINFIVDKNNFSFGDMKKKRITKLFIRGGDILYFCKDLKIKDCSSSHYKLISSYLVHPTFYLYAIK